MLLLMQALTFDALAQLNTFGCRADACTRYVEAQFTILADHYRDLETCARKTSRSRMLKNFREVYGHSCVQERYPGVSAELLAGIVNALGTERRTTIMRRFATAPYEYRSGWPDLTLIRGNELRLVEVKTSDRLHRSQLRWVEVFRPLFPTGTYNIARLSKSTPTARVDPIW